MYKKSVIFIHLLDSGILLIIDIIKKKKKLNGIYKFLPYLTMDLIWNFYIITIWL